MKRTERSTTSQYVVGENWRLANAKSSMLQDNPDAARMYEIHVKNGRREKEFFIKSWKTSAVSTTVWMVETQLCKLRGTSDTFV